MVSRSNILFLAGLFACFTSSLICESPLNLPTSSDIKRVPLCKSNNDPQPLTKCINSGPGIATPPGQNLSFLVKSVVCEKENSSSYLQELLPNNYHTRCQNIYVAFGADTCLVSVGCACYVMNTDRFSLQH